jgi:hypothetical protein
VLDEISLVGSLSSESQLETLSDDAFTARMWRLQLHCEDMSQKFSFRRYSETLYSFFMLMKVLSKYADTTIKKLQFDKELQRLKNVAEELLAESSVNLQVCAKPSSWSVSH